MRSRSRLPRIFSGDHRPDRALKFRFGLKCLNRRGHGNFPPILDKRLEVKLDRFAGHHHRFINRGPCGEAAGKIRDCNAVVRRRIFMNGNRVIHGSSPAGASHDTRERASRHIFFGMRHDNQGIGLRWVLEDPMTSASSMEDPSFATQSCNDFAAAHHMIVSNFRQSRKT